ncbi:MAG: hypothetical protein ACQEV6_05230 [Pseudomonadota bacterium]
MPLKALLVAILTIAVAVGAGRYLAVDNSDLFSWLGEGNGGGSLSTAAPAIDAAPSSPSPGTDGPSKPSDDALGFMLASVADSYQQTIRHPEYSVPLTNEQAEAYQGNRYQPVKLPLEGDGVFTVTLEKYRYTQQEDILVVASLSGPQVVGDRLEAQLESTASRTRTDTATLSPSDDTGYFQGTLRAEGEPGEYRLIVEARVDGRAVRHASTLTIEPDLGEFDGVGQPSIRGNDLVIPVAFEPRESGYYALTAQLVHKGNPIAQLQAEKRLDGGGNTIELKAHGTVLANRDIRGELQLKHLQIQRLPARPGDRTDYAFGPEEGYSFSPPDLDGLTDTPAGNPESEQRAALLRQLANKF